MTPFVVIKTLGHSIVSTIAGTAHATEHFIGFKGFLKGKAAILTSTICVEDQSRSGIAAPGSH